MDDKTPGKYRFRKPDISSKSADKRVASAFTISQSKKRSSDDSRDTDAKSSRISSAKDATTGNSIKDKSKEDTRVNQKQLLSFADEEEDDG